MPLRDVIKHELICCSPEDSVKSAAKVMQSRDVGAILVCENDKPLGILTDRDIVLRCVTQGESADIPVSRVMTRTVDVIHEEAGIQDVIRHMRDKQIRRLPVVDAGGKIIGLISFGDLFALFAKEMSDLTSNTAFDVAA